MNTLSIHYFTSHWQKGGQLHEMLQSLVVILTAPVLGKAVLTLWGSYKGQVLSAVGEPGRNWGLFPSLSVSRTAWR